ncbi:PIG-L family deacetylase [Saccharomonospora xinjiangensis]|uniref:PIG-L family deacetylase n=1 Tax=Saccharomonospora xinjiangensis TaxID=75294 RepID=UPI00106F49AD|nr:PIG-L family deacetylase [Saccharomonospora xinjiangensis]QBQ60694.1 GlcNAc-PI de-N-acetylase [Saccharomonospora xinjiangensis]
MTGIVFHVSGHPDDVLLFRGSHLWNDLTWTGMKTVVVVTTAGDAGFENGWWQAREAGLVEACRVAGGGAAKPEVITVKGHTATHAVTRYLAPTWRCYFLRLPDGNLDGNGFPATKNQSLPKLRDGKISGIDSVASGGASLASQHYASWIEVVDTLHGILTAERQGSDTVHPWVNASDYDRKRDSGSHPDHYATGDALQTFVHADGYYRAWWLSYCTDGRPTNLSGAEYDHKRKLYYSYVEKVKQLYGGAPPCDFDGEWARWGKRCYWSEEKS